MAGDGADRWVVDPIDGTKSFVSGVPLFATLVSFEKDAMPVVAACYIAALDEMYWAELGKGAFLNGKRISVSDTQQMAGSRIVSGSVLTLKKQNRLLPLLDACAEAMIYRTWGDAYGHCLVASGRADAMVDPIVNHWDISAMSLIVKEAGGIFTQLNGDQTLGDSALAANPHLHSYLLQVLQIK